jgi:molybdopterin-guanine dinucleotide biosynthesis protein A
MYHQSVGDVTAFVLAGGKSTRMGADKAFLELGGRTLLARTLELARSVAPEVRIVGGVSAKFAPFSNTVEDVYRDRGPLGGIHAALATSKTELNLMLAVDLPFVEARLLEYLIAQARASGAVVTVPRAAGGLQPLCAVYRREFAAVAARSLQKGQNKIDALFAQVETRVLGEKEIASLGLPETMFQNLNTPDDWSAADQRLKARLRN